MRWKAVDSRHEVVVVGVDKEDMIVQRGGTRTIVESLLWMASQWIGTIIAVCLQRWVIIIEEELIVDRDFQARCYQVCWKCRCRYMVTTWSCSEAKLQCRFIDYQCSILWSQAVGHVNYRGQSFGARLTVRRIR